MRLESLHALLSGQGQDLLARAAREYDGSDALALGSRLRRRYDSGLVAAALSQLELRRKAMAKFGDDAARMYFTPTALEQATPRTVADHRARRLATSGGTSLVDLGCGIGSDLIAAARAGLDVTGVEHDPVRVELARANLAALDLPGQVVEGSAEDTDLSEFDLVFADPARRDQRGRVFDPAAYSPPFRFVEGLLTSRTACVKISPAIPHRLVPPGVEAEWVSDRGEVKEAALWSGSLATTQRRATLLPGGATLAATGVSAPTAPVGPVLYEPDGAVIRAGLVGELAEQLGACLLDPRIAYLTADLAVETPFARRFTVVEHLPYREKQLRAALRARDVGTLTIKKRGVDVSPEVLRGRLALRGSRPATIVLTRAGGAATALLVERA
ncbi:MAG: class I SAM-dependent methyltransferase [Nocardioidaceae bacterium]